MSVVAPRGVWRVLLASSGQRTRVQLNVSQRTQWPPSPTPPALSANAAEAEKLWYKGTCKIRIGPVLGMVLGNWRSRERRAVRGKLGKGRTQVDGEEGDHRTPALLGLKLPKREKTHKVRKQKAPSPGSDGSFHC